MRERTMPYWEARQLGPADNRNLFACPELAGPRIRRNTKIIITF
jgi:hypothetical protein